MNQEDRKTCEAALACIRGAERNICEVVSKRIRHEKRNFEHLVTGQPYSEDPLHKKAVSQYSFEEVGAAMKYLSHVVEFRRDATEVSRLCEQRNTAALDLINELEPRLALRCGE